MLVELVQVVLKSRNLHKKARNVPNWTEPDVRSGAAPVILLINGQ